MKKTRYLLSFLLAVFIMETGLQMQAQTPGINPADESNIFQKEPENRGSDEKTYKVVRGERPPIDLQAINPDAYEPAVLLIKFADSQARALETNPPMINENGLVFFNIQAVDALNQEFQAREAKQHFLHPALGNTFTERHKAWGFHLWYRLEFDSEADVLRLVQEYGRLDEIAVAEPEYKKQLIGGQETINKSGEPEEGNAGSRNWTPNDPMFSTQWHYHNTGQQSGTPGADIDLIAAWVIEKGHPDVIVAIIDDGIQFNHPDLAANMWQNAQGHYGYNFVDNTTTIVPGNHGTHVAGTVAAVSNNGVGVAGVAGGSGTGDGVRLMSCQVFTSSGQGGFHLAPIFAADSGAAISQNSWGYDSPNVYNQNVLDAIDYFNSNGGGSVMQNGITIFAAGNSNSSANYYPAYYSGALSVAGTNNNDQKSWYSNYGAWLDISAPGGETNSLTARGVSSTITGSNYAYYQGTSMACPHVSGVAALLVSYAHRNTYILERSEVWGFLVNNVDDHYPQNPSYTGQLGSGRLNANLALLALIDMLIDVFGPPTGLVATVVNDNDIDLIWDAPAGPSMNETVKTINKVQNFAIDDFEVFSASTELVENPELRSQPTLTGFKVYRNNEEIIHINDPLTTAYTDAGMPFNHYSYYVTALYASPEGESEPSNIEEILLSIDSQPWYDGGTAATSALDTANSINLEVAENFVAAQGVIDEVVFYGLTLFHNGENWQEQIPDTIEPFIIRFYEFKTEGANVLEPEWNTPLATRHVNARLTELGRVWEDTYTLYRFNALLNTAVYMEQGWLSVQIDAANGSGTWFLWMNSLEGDGMAWQNTNPESAKSGSTVMNLSSISMNGNANSGRSSSLDYDLAFQLYGVMPPPSTWTGVAGNNWSDSGNWSHDVPGNLNDAFIPVSVRNPALNSLAEVENLHISSGTLLSVAPEGRLSVSGNLINNGEILIQSNASGTGSLIHHTAGVQATVQQYFNGAENAWHQLSSPVEAQDIETGFDDGNLMTWHEPAQAWVFFTVTSTVWPTWDDANSNTNHLIPGKGYMAAYPYDTGNPQTKEFEGVLNIGTVSNTLLVKAHPDDPSQGFNLLGNPYPSSIDWKADDGWSGRNNLHIPPGSAGYNFWIWNAAGGNYGAYNSGSIGDAGTLGTSRYIPPMQGFWVRAVNDEAEIGVKNAARVHSTQQWLKKDKVGVLHLAVTGNDLPWYDETLIEFGHHSSTGGAEKMFSHNAQSPSLFTFKENKAFSISFLSGMNEHPSVALGFIAGKDGIYTLSVGETITFTQLILEDKLLGIYHNLAAHNQYHFPGSINDSTDRFILHFKAVGIAEISEAKPVVRYLNNNLYIENPWGGILHTEIYDAGGRLLVRLQNSGTGTFHYKFHVAPGVYFVRCHSQNKAMATRLLVY